MIVDKQLVISNRKKADIVGDLKKHEFRPYPKGPKAVTTETSPEQDEDDDEGETVMSTTTDFDYLLSMGIWNLTKEKVSRQLILTGGLLLTFMFLCRSRS